MATATVAHRDERLTRTGVGRRLLTRPELGAGVGAIAVFTFFAVYTDQFATARGIGNMLDPAATLGIMAVVVAMLMIGGEFDLSAGVMTASSGLLRAGSLVTSNVRQAVPRLRLPLMVAVRGAGGVFTVTFWVSVCGVAAPLPPGPAHLSQFAQLVIWSISRKEASGGSDAAPTVKPTEVFELPVES